MIYLQAALPQGKGSWQHSISLIKEAIDLLSTSWHRDLSQFKRGYIYWFLYVHSLVTSIQVSCLYTHWGLSWRINKLFCWDRNIPGKLGQYIGCWCPGSFHRHVISSHNIHCMQRRYPCLPWEWISTTCGISVLRNDMKYKSVFFLFFCFFSIQH